MEAATTGRCPNAERSVAPRPCNGSGDRRPAAWQYRRRRQAREFNGICSRIPSTRSGRQAGKGKLRRSASPLEPGDEIQRWEEEGVSPMEEEKSQKSFLQPRVFLRRQPPRPSAKRASSCSRLVDVDSAAWGFQSWKQ
uniref:Uncharacterized protein n=1 Tax=Laticauda laticaudata TaxID=8630 RepID=A0A8C5WZM9_LATLA